MSAAPIADRRDRALAARAAGDRALALALFREADDPWSRNDAALELLALGLGGQAIEAAEALARERPDFAPARRTLGLALREAGEREAALGAFRAAAARDRADLWSAFDAAQELRTLGRDEEAEAALRALAGATPLPHTIRALGRAARERGDWESALASLRVAADLLPADPWFALDHAEALIALGRLDEGEAALGTLRRRHPSFAGAVRALVRLAARRGDGAARIAHARDLARLDPEAGPLDLADALLDAGETAEAETLAARHLACHGPGPRPLRLLARAARRSGDRERALDHLQAAARSLPNDAALRAELASDAIALERVRQAEAEAQAALDIDPACQPARRVLALAARARGEEAEALALARADWADGTGPVQAGFDLGADLRAAGALDEARAVYKALTGRIEAAPDALVELALLARRLEGVDEARAKLRAALDRSPRHPRALLCLGDIEREAGRLDAAETLYAEALAARPGLGWAHVGRALVLEARGEAVPADDAWRDAIAADPSEAHPRIAFAQRLAERGEGEAARALLAAVPAASPRALDAALALARIRRLEGDGPGALADLTAAARRWPDRPDGFIEAADEALRLGRPDEALELLAEAEARHPRHPSLLEARARHALSRDDLDVAFLLFEKAGRDDPGRLWPQLMQARLLAMRGAPGEGLARFEAIGRRFGERPELAMLHAETLRQLGRIEEAEARLGAAREAPQLALAGALSAIECGRLPRARDLLDGLPTATRADRARLHFARAQLASARWDFAGAIREGEEAVRLQPLDGWYRNRLAHAALLALDLPRAARVLTEAAALEAGANALRGKSANPSQSHYGQLLDEFRLDAEALAALRTALEQPAETRLPAIAATVRAFPDYTPAAILLFIEARRQDALPQTLGTGDGGIPRSIHQFWTDERIPDDVAAYMASWRERNPTFRHTVWSEASARAYLATHGSRPAADAFERAREPAMKADLFRLALLSREGGIWADADDRCLAPVEPLLSRGAGLVTYQEDLGSLGNNWLAARPGHPVLLRALQEGAAAVNRGDGDILWLATGPGLLTRVLARAWADRTRDSADDALVLDRQELLRFVAIHCLAAYKASERHWSRTAFGRGGRAKGGQAKGGRPG